MTERRGDRILPARRGGFALAVLAVTALVGVARGQDAPPESRPENRDNLRLPPALINALENLGANSAVPDGIGVTAYPMSSVRRSRSGAELGWTDLQFGLTTPVVESATDGVFLTAAFQQRSFRTRGLVRLPDDRVPFPEKLTRVDVGGTYLHVRDDGDSYGLSLLGGTASDKPFKSFRDANATALAFYRLTQENDTAWMFYVVSSTHGQVGNNIPIPGVAYEVKGEDYTATLGFPFVNAKYRPLEQWELEFNYAALTDVLLRAHYRPAPNLDLFGGFAWLNQSWFRNRRPNHDEQLFYYEKRLESGVDLRLGSGVSFQLLGGWAFDRLYTESTGLPIYGRNRVRLSPGAFATAQLQFKY